MSTGYAVEIWKALERALNFTTELHVAKSFGKEKENGTWNGMVNSTCAQ